MHTHIDKARKNKRQTRTSNPVMLKQQEIVCSNAKCSKIFSEPIKLTIRSEQDGSLETYHACPHCFSRINVPSNSKRHLREAPLGALKKVLKETANDIEKNKLAGCAHFIGYLKTRPKDSPIPDDCLTCAAIMQCM